MNMAKFLLFPLLLINGGVAQAANYDAVYAFGDSLTDNGLQHPTIPAAPYDNGRFSNGPVAVEYLANSLGVSLQDYAVAGAETGWLNPDLQGTAFANTGVLSQVNLYAATHASADSNALYFLWAGANDLLNAMANGSDLNVATQNAVTNIVAEVQILESMGAKHILIPNLNNLGNTPQVAALGSGVVAAADLLTQGFDAALAAALPADVVLVNTYQQVNELLKHPLASGFANVTDPCLLGAVVCANPDSYLFWDSLHPTTAAHQVLANEFAAALVPLPPSFYLMLVGLLSFGFKNRAVAG